MNHLDHVQFQSLSRCEAIAAARAIEDSIGMIKAKSFQKGIEAMSQCISEGDISKENLLKKAEAFGLVEDK